MKPEKEWFADAPWGKIALVAWGDDTKPPVLLVHGYMDTAATFIPLLKLLPDSHYYYVGVDFPGHGKSDHFPVGPVMSQVHLVDTIRTVVEHMKWDTFIYMGHSMAFLIGLYFNAVNPGKISKMINLDSGPPLSVHYYPVLNTSPWYQALYQNYYDTFHRNYSKPLLYKYDDAINLVVRKRLLAEDEAEAVLSRSLVPVGDKFRLSWAPAMKWLANLQLDACTLVNLITKNSPPMLNIAATEDTISKQARSYGAKILKNVQKKKPDFFIKTVTGAHDVHITSPELFIDYIIEFLKTVGVAR